VSVQLYKQDKLSITARLILTHSQSK